MLDYDVLKRENVDSLQTLLEMASLSASCGQEVIHFHYVSSVSVQDADEPKVIILSVVAFDVRLVVYACEYFYLFHLFRMYLLNEQQVTCAIVEHKFVMVYRSCQYAGRLCAN